MSVFRSADRENVCPLVLPPAPPAAAVL